MTKKIKNICCIGAGYVGGPTMAVIADRCPDLNVNLIDINEKRIDAWNNPNCEEIPIYEPGLSEIIKRCRNKNLFFSTNIKENIACADIVFISVNTPTKKKGIGAGQASDLKWVEASARQVADYSQGHTIVVEKSTLPVRTAEVIKSILKSSQESRKSNITTFEVLSNPEFLSEGSAIKDLENPDRVLIGGESKAAIEILADIYKHWVPKQKILRTNLWSSELAKLTSNAFLAQRISSINSISAICEATGADVREVSRAIGTDSRIGSKFLDSGPGFGGSCFKKDILNLVYLCSYYGLHEVANFWESVVKLNYWHQHRVAKLIVKKLFGTLSNKKIAILGFAFKANTNDTRESAAIQICNDLMEEGAILRIHDPKVTKSQIEIDMKNNYYQPTNEKKEFTSDLSKNWNKVDSLEDVFQDCDAALIITEWDEYSKIDWVKAAKKMRKPSWVFDSRSITNSIEVLKAGLKYWLIGDGTNSP